MKTIGRIAAIGACAALFAGCGGGGGSSPQTAIPKAAPSPTGSPVGSASLTIAFPTNFHVAKLGSTSQTSSKTRTPAYVNPGNYTLNVYLDGASAYSNSISGSNPQGTQTITLPIYSTSSHQIVAVETNGGSILSLGETDLSENQITPGAPVAIGLTMLMNAEYIGLMSDPNDAHNDAYVGNYWYSDTGYDSVCSAGQSMAVYPFAADEVGGFVSGSSGGAGAPLPTLASWSDADQASSGDSVVPISGTPAYGSTIDFAYVDSSDGGEGVRLNYTVPNPVYAIVTDYQNDNGQFPGIAALINNNTISYGALNQNQAVTRAFFIQPNCP